ncbi:uncharacterized protein LOC113638718 [Tachysurus fulvidraco]|uniref:uncharacterized protein LOC113638718 n=1 Tax=Tachysurus fulvidraco TaxID=1234273 RepID=UPI001FEED164|nr:uncharacterized protein LOC113638718 [Tachysurus fulvidraco]
MASAPLPFTNVGSGYTVVTQVLPSSTAEQNSTQTLGPLSKFLKGEPKALGTVQIMVGLLTLLFGIVLVTFPESFIIFSGVVFWSPVFHIISGSLAVSASNKLNSCVVKATLTLNIFSTVSAGIAIIFLILQLVFGSYGYSYYSYSAAAEVMGQGITGVLLVFTLLQFCISIALSVFTCKATCTSEPTVNIINVVQNPESFAPSAPVNNPFPPHHTQQEVNMMHGIAMATAPRENPPAYSEKIKFRLCGVKMASAPVPFTNVGRGYTVVTQVIPSSTEEQNSTQTFGPLSKFLKGEPKALGTVQIMIGLLTLLFGIVLVAFPQTSIFSGIVFWGPAFHIIAGSLAVSASNKLNSCVVKATLTLNIFSALSAGTTIIILILDLIFWRNSYRRSHYEYSYSYHYYNSEVMGQGITGVLLVFALLQFCISIALSAFACKATSTSGPTLNIINVVPNPESVAPSAPVNNPFPPYHTQQGVNMMHGVTMATAPGRNPPAYSEKILKGQTLWCKDGQRSCICL